MIFFSKQKELQEHLTDMNIEHPVPLRLQRTPIIKQKQNFLRQKTPSIDSVHKVHLQ